MALIPFTQTESGFVPFGRLVRSVASCWSVFLLNTGQTTGLCDLFPQWNDPERFIFFFVLFRCNWLHDDQTNLQGKFLERYLDADFFVPRWGTYLELYIESIEKVLLLSPLISIMKKCWLSWAGPVFLAARSLDLPTVKFLMVYSYVPSTYVLVRMYVSRSVCQSV